MPSSLQHSGAPPLAALAARRRLALIVGALAVLASGAWCLWPHGDPTISIQPPPERSPHTAAARVAQPLDLAAFSAPVWDAPPLPPKPVVVTEKPPPPPPPLPPPLKLQLLGIVRDEVSSPDGSPIYIAAIYDEANDRLLMLRAGDNIGASGAGRIARVHADAVELSEPAGLRRLALRQPIVPIPGLSAPVAPGSSASPGTPAAKPSKGKP